MEIERLFNSTIEFRNAKIDWILFEGYYPVLFTMEDGDKEYLFCCPETNKNETVWIAALVDPLVVVDMLCDRITIRDAFDACSKVKYILVNDHNGMSVERVDQGFPDYYLPTAGEYMEAEPDEFEEEISYYQRKSMYDTFECEPMTWNLYSVFGARAVLKIPAALHNENRKIRQSGSVCLSYVFDKAVDLRVGG